MSGPSLEEVLDIALSAAYRIEYDPYAITNVDSAIEYVKQAL